MHSKYDAILYFNPNYVNESNDDPRVHTKKQVSATSKGYKSNAEWFDPKYYSQFSFANSIRSQLSNMGAGYSCKVTEFGMAVVVEVTHHNTLTGRSASKTFLILFDKQGDGHVMSTHNRYRTISGVGQAVSYIRSSASSLQTSNQSIVG